AHREALGTVRCTKVVRDPSVLPGAGAVRASDEGALPDRRAVGASGIAERAHRGAIRAFGAARVPDCGAVVAAGFAAQAYGGAAAAGSVGALADSERRGAGRARRAESVSVVAGNQACAGGGDRRVELAEIDRIGSRRAVGNVHDPPLGPSRTDRDGVRLVRHRASPQCDRAVAGGTRALTEGGGAERIGGRTFADG